MALLGLDEYERHASILVGWLSFALRCDTQAHRISPCNRACRKAIQHEEFLERSRFERVEELGLGELHHATIDLRDVVSNGFCRR